jgi:glycosyltransferase involved in cell wall biosynthesis
MRIALILPPWKRTPPDGYGGIEIVADLLVKGLRRRGITVEVFTIAGSMTKADRLHHFFVEEQYSRIIEPFNDVAPVVVCHLQHALNVIQQDGQFDLIHDFTGIDAHLLVWANLDPAGHPPVLFTLHGPLHTEMLREVCQGGGRFLLNSISRSQVGDPVVPSWLSSRLVGIVYNGIDLDRYRVHADKQNYFISMARHTWRKGQDRAARHCAAIGAELRLCGLVATLEDPDVVRATLADRSSPLWSNQDFIYHAAGVAPYLRNRQIKFLGNVGGSQKERLLGHALALLNLLSWTEPFGVSVVEALACGTPVVTTPIGAATEIVQDGVNGFVVSQDAEIEDCLRRLLNGTHELTPAACRQRAEYFSADRMCDGYEILYGEMLRRYD